MRSDELIERARRRAGISTVAAWPDWADARILDDMNERQYSLASDEIVKARAGYGAKIFQFTTTTGIAEYPVPDRAISGSFDKLEIQVTGSNASWRELEKEEFYNVTELERAAPGLPEKYCVEDGYLRLFPTPNQAYTCRVRFYIRPSRLVTSQSSTAGGDGIVRGQITALNKTARTVTVNVVPFDQLLSPPAAITSALQRLDIVRASGQFQTVMYSQPQTLAGSVFTLGGTDSMDRVQVGDWVRVADQSDWPSNIPEEYQSILSNRTAMEIAAAIGVEERVQLIGAVVQADVERWRSSRMPQVKSAPRDIPLFPMGLR